MTNTNFRNLLNIARGLGRTDTEPTEAERIAAAQALDHRISDNDMMAPGLFAGDIYGHIITNHDEWLDAICPDEAAACCAASRQIRPRIPRRGRRFT